MLPLETSPGKLRLPKPPLSSLYLLVQCETLKASRIALIKELKTISTYAYLKLQKSTNTEKTAIILGKKPKKLENKEWKKVQPAFAKHTYRIQEKIKEML